TPRATIDLHVDFHRPALPGQLRAIGRLVKMGRQFSVAETRIVGTDGVLLASGRGAYVCE
ncbi:hotdog fold thioesterase, partial [Acinetobacter baumannii]